MVLVHHNIDCRTIIVTSVLEFSGDGPGWGVDGKVGVDVEVGYISGVGGIVPPQSSGGSSGLSRNYLSMVVIFVIIVLADARKSDRNNNGNNTGRKGVV